MHWTLQTLLLLCVAMSIFNIVEWIVTRSIRTAGIFICIGWGVQQAYWWLTGGDSFVLFVVCDAAIIAWFLWQHFRRRRIFDLAERLVAGTIPFTTALAAFQWLNDGHTTLSWWTNWSLVAGQMILGLPLLKGQKVGGSLSHGKLRGQSHGSV